MSAMKRAVILAAAALTVVLAGSSAQATEVGGRRPLGLGFAIGSPVSLVGKYFLNQTNAVDFGLSFWHYGNDCDYRADGGCHGVGSIGLVGDYLWHDTLARGTAQLDWHFGPGGRLWIGNHSYDHNAALAARFPVGLDLTFDRPNFLEVFMEIAPVLFIVPDVFLDLEAFVGVRFYF